MAPTPRKARMIGERALNRTCLTSAMTPFDIVPETGPEVAVTTVAVFFGLFINIIIISSVTSALQSLDSKRLVGRQQLETVTRYLLFKRVPPKLCAPRWPSCSSFSSSPVGGWRRPSNRPVPTSPP